MRCKHVSPALKAEVAALSKNDAPSALVEKDNAKAVAAAAKQSPALTSKSSGAATKSGSSGQQTLDVLARDGGKQARQNRFNLALVKFVAVTGIPAHTIGSEEFKDMISIANSALQPVSDDTLLEKLIPFEAAACRAKSLDKLRGERNLTISFDGGTTRMTRTIYTVHVTTSSRESHLMLGDESSGESHTADYIVKLLRGVSLAEESIEVVHKLIYTGYR